MSKLYETISRLDKIASLEESSRTSPDIPFQQVKSKDHSSARRIIAISGLIILLGLLVLGMTSKLDNLLGLGNSSEPTVQTRQPPRLPDQTVSPAPPQHHSPSNSQLMVEQLDSPVTMAFATTPMGELDIPAQTVKAQTMQSSRVNHQIDEKQPENKTREILQPKDIEVLDEEIGKKVLQNVSLIEENKQIPLDKLVEQASQASRWLQQAEQHRRAGEWDGAIVLFTKVWSLSKNPAVANNLAACLMQLDRLEEAQDILAQALLKTPKDQELNQNSAIVHRLIQREATR